MIQCFQCGTDNRDGARFCQKCGQPLLIGQTLQGRYQIQNLLGKGGMGAVYQGRDNHLSKPVAIKENLDTSPEAQRQFQQEAQILSDLSHSNLPRVIDHFSIRGQGQYLVMDLVEGENLQEKLDNTGSPLATLQVLSWIDQICGALSYLHTHQPPIIHRDIKPANIKITPQGKAVLVDFGISKVFDPLAKTTIGARGVTPGYSPTEQYGQGKTDARSDIYALGATLYTLLTGVELPEATDLAVNPALLKRPSQIVPGFDTALEQVILRAIQLDPNRRFQAANELKQALSNPQAMPRQNLPPVVGPGDKPFFWRDGTVSLSAEDLVVTANRSWDEALGYFAKADWQEWLPKIHRNDLVPKLAQIKQQHSNVNVALDSFLRLLDPHFPAAQLRIVPAVMDLGVRPWQTRHTQSIEICNVGAGWLHGSVAIQPVCDWLRVSTKEFGTHERDTIHFKIDTSKLQPVRTPYQSSISFSSNGGSIQVPISVIVPEPQLVVDRSEVDFGMISPGDRPRETIPVRNPGGSRFALSLTSDPNNHWATGNVGQEIVEPGGTEGLIVSAEAEDPIPGPHEAKLILKAEAGSWFQEQTISVKVNWPKFKTYQWRWGAMLDGAALGALVTVLLFWMVRSATSPAVFHTLVFGSWWPGLVVWLGPAIVGGFIGGSIGYLMGGYAHVFGWIGLIGGVMIGLLVSGVLAWFAARPLQFGLDEFCFWGIVGALIGGSFAQARHGSNVSGIFAGVITALALFSLAYFILRPAVPAVLEAKTSSADGMRQVLVPASEFTMGSPLENPAAEQDEKPAHAVFLDAYWIDQTEVTNGMYNKCVQAGRCRALQEEHRTFGSLVLHDYLPATGLVWQEATAYCQWAGRRLPTEAEWEKAARGTVGRIYPWGNEQPDSERLNQRVGFPVDVGRYPDGASPYGALDMAGNVMEWVSDWYAEDYFALSELKNPIGPAQGTLRVARGDELRSTGRFALPADQRWPNKLGFRCAESATSAEAARYPTPVVAPAAATATAQAHANTVARAQVAATATAQAALAVTATAAAARVQLESTIEAGRGLAFGPHHGTLSHNVDDKIELHLAQVNLSDFEVEARFFNPYAASTHRWDFGFLFRHAGPNQHFGLAILSTNEWALFNSTGSPAQGSISNGPLNNLNLGAEESNVVKLICQGGKGWLYLNGTFAAELDLSARTNPGDVSIATGILQDSETAGSATRYENFTVWSLR
jgi:serine/threonine-protein kinase